MDIFSVYIVFFLETAQTALSGADLYLWFVTGFGNLEYLTGSAFQFFDVPILGSVVSLIVQFFFAYRILVLSEKRSWWLCIIICLVSLLQKVPEPPHHPSIALCCQRIWGIRTGYVGEMVPLHITRSVSQLHHVTPVVPWA